MEKYSDVLRQLADVLDDDKRPWADRESEVTKRLTSLVPGLAQRPDMKKDALGSRMLEMRAWLVGLMPTSREQSLALTKLDECELWAMKGLELHCSGKDPESKKGG
jgi:hypothetical protein